MAKSPNDRMKNYTPEDFKDQGALGRRLNKLPYSVKPVTKADTDYVDKKAHLDTAIKVLEAAQGVSDQMQRVAGKTPKSDIIAAARRKSAMNTGKTYRGRPS